MPKKVANSFNEVADFVGDLFDKETAKKITSGTQNIIHKTGQRIVRNIKANHPWDDKTGALTRSLRSRKRGRLDVVLFSNQRYHPVFQRIKKTEGNSRIK